MKRAKRIYILLGVLAVVCIAAFAVMQYQEQQEIIQNTDEIILEVDSSTVQSLSWEYESETLAFHKDGTWLYDEDEAFPVDEEKMNALLETFQAFGASFIIHDVTDFAQYGLDDPVCTIDLTTEDTSYEIQLGDYSTMDAQRYVSIGDGNVYLVQEDPLDTFDVELSDLIDNDETPIFDQVESIQFTGSSSQRLLSGTLPGREHLLLLRRRRVLQGAGRDLSAPGHRPGGQLSEHHHQSGPHRLCDLQRH